MCCFSNSGCVYLVTCLFPRKTTAPSQLPGHRKTLKCRPYSQARAKLSAVLVSVTKNLALLIGRDLFTSDFSKIHTFFFFFKQVSLKREKKRNCYLAKISVSQLHPTNAYRHQSMTLYGVYGEHTLTEFPSSVLGFPVVTKTALETGNSLLQPSLITQSDKANIIKFVIV